MTKRNMPTLQQIIEASEDVYGAINKDTMQSRDQNLPMRGADGVLFYVGDEVKCVSPNTRVSRYETYTVYAVDHRDVEGTDPIVLADDGNYRMIFAHRFIKV